MSNANASRPMPAIAAEYLDWLVVEKNRSPLTAKAYDRDLKRLFGFLAAAGHSLNLGDLGWDDLRAFQRQLARDLPDPSSRARALTAVRSWLKWMVTQRIWAEDLVHAINLPKVERPLPKPIEPDEVTKVLRELPRESLLQKRDRALVFFLIDTGCRISEALRLDLADWPPTRDQLIVTGKGNKQRMVMWTAECRQAMDEYLKARSTDGCPALFINFNDQRHKDAREHRLTDSGARHIVKRVRQLAGAWSFRSPHSARHTAATTLLEVTGGDVRLVQEVLGHANLSTLQGYTKIVDQRKRDAYDKLRNSRQGSPQPG